MDSVSSLRSRIIPARTTLTHCEKLFPVACVRRILVNFRGAIVAPTLQDGSEPGTDEVYL